MASEGVQTTYSIPFPMLKQYVAVECDVIICAEAFFAANPLLMGARLINRPHSGAAASIALAAREAAFSWPSYYASKICSRSTISHAFSLLG